MERTGTLSDSYTVAVAGIGPSLNVALNRGDAVTVRGGSLDGLRGQFVASQSDGRCVVQIGDGPVVLVGPDRVALLQGEGNT